MELTVNGDAVQIDGPVDVPGLLAHMGFPDEGVAIAVDGVVRPKSRWSEEIGEYAEIDVLTAVQGG
ncbi:sulfur carrier protein ThiS [Gordonia sp. HY002]|uniref:sulfur carrier protein ThiS n=1 Tax=Gordonia zhenghanii TaxID=2911516 RepID=UPI001EEFCAD6|nr:sulfur carrier protein ThiS [Gordonia zhenghanii]MCF8571864.1 sulfur carrier protein ThiS [Gordonia zhenghanii]MCF8604423.1 sulfur carrier protein ThiS [Gordonia zhenghanii]